MRLTSSGKLGIGTSSPSTKFVVSNSGAEGFEFSHSSGTNELNSFNRNTSGRSPIDIIGQTFKVITGNPSLTTGLFQDSSGRVGIGTTTGAVGGAPSSQTGQFNVISSAGSGQWAIQARADNAAGNGLFVRAGANSSFYTAYLTGNDENNVHMVVRGDGKVGIGTNNPSAKLSVIDDTGITIEATTNAEPGKLTIIGKNNIGQVSAITRITSVPESSSNAATTTTFNNRNSSNNVNEHMRIDSSGNVMIGRTSVGNTGNGHVIRGGDSVIFSRDATGETMQVTRNNSNGDIIQFRTGDSGNASICGEIVRTGASTVAYNTSSDYRLKENEVAISDGITRLKLLKPYRFNFKSEPDRTVDGFFAHEVTPSVPEAVFGEKDDPNRMQGIDQAKLVPLLVAALQEAIGRIEALEAK